MFVSTPSCQLLGYLYEEGKGVEKSKKSALDLFQIGCQHDDEVGCYTLGKRYETSDGSDYNRDYNKAEFYFIKSCKLGFGEACFELATMYATDEYGKKSVTNHIKQLQRSCELEYAKGCTELGTMYVISYVNKTLPNNITDPLEPLKLACKYGDPEGCNRLGESYKEGFVNTTNLEKAKEYFDLACKLDSNYCE